MPMRGKAFVGMTVAALAACLALVGPAQAQQGGAGKDPQPCCPELTPYYPKSPSAKPPAAPERREGDSPGQGAGGQGASGWSTSGGQARPGETQPPPPAQSPK